MHPLHFSEKMNPRIRFLLPTILFAQFLLFTTVMAQERFTWEIQVVNEGEDDVLDVVVDANDPNTELGRQTLGYNETCDIHVVDSGGCIEDAETNLLMRIEISSDAGSYDYLYYYCEPPKEGFDLSADGFFCPNNEGLSAGNSDIRIKYTDEGAISVEPVGTGLYNGSNPDDIHENFSDQNWIAPYNLDYYCGSEGTCYYWKVPWFLTPQTDTDTFTFTTQNLSQHSSRVWDWNHVTVNFPASKDLTINGGLKVDDSTIDFGNYSDLFYESTASEFVVTGSTTFELGEDVRFTLESNIDVDGAVGDSVYFKSRTGSEEWEYLSLKADDNTFDYVVFEDGWKTIEVESNDNTFTDVAFRDGWRGISSYYVVGGGNSSFTLTDCTVKNNSTEGVIAYHTDLTMDNTTVQGNGKAGVWFQYAEAAEGNFTNNTITGNAQVTSTSSGVELGYNGILETGNNAYNDITNNPHHEIYVVSNAELLAGVNDSGDNGGYNNIYDTGSQGIGEKYIYHSSSHSAVAENNCWNGDPTSHIYGDVDFTPFLSSSCASSKRSLPLATEGNSILKRILDARKKVVDSFPDYVAEEVAYLYVMQQLDRGDVLGERKSTLAVIADVRNTRIQMGESASRGLKAAGERAMLLELHDAQTNEKYEDAKGYISLYDRYIVDPPNRVELLMGEIGLLEYDQKYSNALAVTAEVRGFEKKKGEFDVMLDIVEQTLRERIEESTGVMPALPAPKMAETHTGNRNTENSDEKALPSTFELLSPYPNPFNPSVIIPFNLSVASTVEMTVYDMLGRQVATVADRLFGEGAHAVVFTADKLSSGTYVLHVRMSSADGQGFSDSRLISLQK